MTSTTKISSTPAHGTIAFLPLPIGVGLCAGGLAVTLAAIVGLIGDTDVQAFERASQLILGLGSIAIGMTVARLHPRGSISRSKAMVMFVASWVAMTAVAVVAFVIAGDLESPLDAVFEAVSASTTTGFTTVADPAELSHSFRFLRVIMPWATGLGVLLVAMGLLPIAVAGAELLPRRRLGRQRQLVTTTSTAVRNIMGMYALLTFSLFVGFWVAGMGGFDALTYALSTASTGGMANHADSIGHFDSSAVEWVAATGMAAAGGNLLVVWWALRGRLEAVWRSTELRLYVFLTVGGFSVVFFGSDLGASDSAVAITSMLSTTGLHSSNWASQATFVQAVLVVATGIGAMSGSAGSGFRQARVARIALEVRRSLRTLLEPHRVGIIRIDGEAVKEESLELTYGYLWMHAFTLAGVSLLIYVPDLDLIAALTLSLSLVSNTGILIEDGTLTNVVSLSEWSQVVASFGMLLGRLSIYPVLITIAGLGRWARRQQPRRHIRAGS